ncbi:MAG: SpoVR family protein [Deltaproteobacteria bacterium HGW-Deltaproteobacteria-17]|nr:MAG: SpoVR family protein [Deltaproteobacteria bacterium HGW-Deltaproteobacteria-17]
MLPPYLQEMQTQVEAVARTAGLDFFETRFILVDTKTINEVAAYGGFPSRYPHWRFGMEYDRLAKGSRYGLSKIYELVINNDPCYAYLLEGNNLVDQKMVMAHVMAHNDFFKNNVYFKFTNRKMIDEMANHAVKVQKIIDRIGIESVENFIDICHSMDNLIDPYSLFIARPPATRKELEDLIEEARLAAADTPVGPEAEKKGAVRSYMKGFLAGDRKNVAETPVPSVGLRKEPINPTRDVLGFLLNCAPLEDWQRTILEIVREEAYYFAPQAMTKIMNEGWATFWHSRLMTHHLIDASEVIQFAHTTSGVTAQAPGQLNPYKMGVELFRDIEHRWNRGMHGKAWRDCDDYEKKKHWDTGAGEGLQKIFEVRRMFNDVTFIDEFLTPEFLTERLFYTYDYSRSKNEYVISSREFSEIKSRLLFQLTNGGHPIIAVTDSDYVNRGELLLEHKHYGVDLEVPYAKSTLENLFTIWKKPVNLVTKVKDHPMLLSFDGSEHTSRELPVSAVGG